MGIPALANVPSSNVKMPIGYSLPNETLQQIFSYLGPQDFHSARRTCSTWATAALDRLLLKEMLARSGNRTGVAADIKNFFCNICVADYPHCVHLLSKRLAIECSLQPTWTGNGFPHGTPDVSERSAVDETNIALKKIARTDFAELSGNTESQCNDSCGLGFTTSVCGHFIMITEGCLIHIYQLHGVNIRAIARIVCPRRVLALSMDSSSGRYAIAALLDGRMGFVSDLDIHIPTEDDFPPSSYIKRERKTPSSQSSHNLCADMRARNGDLAGPHQFSVTDQLDERLNSIHIRSPNQHVVLQDVDIGRHWINSTWPNVVLPASSYSRADYEPSGSCAMPSSSSPLSIYHSLCSPDDPPRSVAICPSRRCLAFGCAAGIELHWIDGSSGRNLMKWFPLTAPSDHLYFLPTRWGIDHPSKLRLISSKSGPGQRGGIKKIARRPSKQRFNWSWGILKFDQSCPVDLNYDHYAAVPLNDGNHVVFTDPTTGALFVGSDGSTGRATKLVRTIRLDPPKDVIAKQSSLKEKPAMLYAASSDIRWGVKVVAVYSDVLVLYSIPPDMFEDIKMIKASTQSELETEDDEPRFGEWYRWWSKNLPFTAPEMSGTSVERSDERSDVWPISICGARIACMPGIVDIAVQSSPDLIIWAFGANGLAETWKVSDRQDQIIAHRVIDTTGAVIDVMEKNGDWIMRDAWPDLSFLTITDAVDADGDSRMSDWNSTNIQRQNTASTDHLFLPNLDGVSDLDREGDILMYNAFPMDQPARFQFAETYLGTEPFEFEILSPAASNYRRSRPTEIVLSRHSRRSLSTATRKLTPTSRHPAIRILGSSPKQSESHSGMDVDTADNLLAMKGSTRTPNPLKRPALQDKSVNMELRVPKHRVDTHLAAQRQGQRKTRSASPSNRVSSTTTATTSWTMVKCHRTVSFIDKPADTEVSGM